MFTCEYTNTNWGGGRKLHVADELSTANGTEVRETNPVCSDLGSEVAGSSNRTSTRERKVPDRFVAVCQPKTMAWGPGLTPEIVQLLVRALKSQIEKEKLRVSEVD